MNTVDGVYVLTETSQEQMRFHGSPPKLKTPLDDGIQPGEGDDVSPPNALKGHLLNALCDHLLANVGFSSASQQLGFAPTEKALTLTLTLNP
jgi:hypothetical protein